MNDSTTFINDVLHRPVVPVFLWLGVILYKAALEHCCSYVCMLFVTI